MDDKIEQHNVFGRNSVVKAVSLTNSDEKAGFVKGIAASVISGVIVALVLKLIGVY